MAREGHGACALGEGERRVLVGHEVGEQTMRLHYGLGDS
jgi:hypothetical protein